MPALGTKLLPQVIETCRQWYLGLCLVPDAATCRVALPSRRRRRPPVTQLGWLVNEQLFQEG